MNTEANQAIDPKVIERIQKMLRLAQDGGATEGEAAVAMELAQETMRKYNLTMAEMELSGKTGTGDAARSKNEVTGKAMYTYQQSLMATIAKVNFCHVTVRQQIKGKRWMPVGYVIIGRQANVTATVQMYSYLNSTIDRLVKPHLQSYRETLSRWAVSFKEGVATRLQERLLERHDAAIREQSRAAKEANAASRHPSAASTGTSLVVVMEDFEQKERDLNNDFRNGYEPGTTAATRASWLAKVKANEERERAEFEAYAEAERVRRANMTEAQRRKEDERNARNKERANARYERERQRYWERRDYGAFVQGKKEANSVGLDQQISKAEDARRIK